MKSTDDFFSVLSDFGKFWESGLPRLGEEGAQGWKSAKKQDAVRSKPQADLMILSTLSSTNTFHKWYDTETQAEQESRPLRSHETFPNDIDPFRVVMFSDIQSLMFPIRTSESLRHLAVAFLRLLGVGIAPPKSPTSVRINNDPHMVPINTSDTFWPSPLSTKDRPWQVIAGEAMEPIRQPHLHKMTDSPVKCWSTTRDTLLGIDWFRDLDVGSIAGKDLIMIRYVQGLLRY